MSILQEIYNEPCISEGTDMSALPEDKFNEIKTNIRKGAQNSGDWPNALALVHRAYKITNVQRPIPDIMLGAWKQYEILIQFSVQQLSKYHGLDADWRLSASTFRETKEYSIQTLKGNGLLKEYTIEAFDLKEVISIIEETIDPQLTMNIKEENDETVLEFTLYDSIKSPYRMLINLVK